MMTDVTESMIIDPRARIRALSDVGAVVSVDSSIPPRRYFRSGMEMSRMANMYHAEGNLENAFIMYTKFITLFVEKLPKHDNYKDASAIDKTNNKKKLKDVFPKAEKIKKILKTRYEEQAKLYAEKAKQHESELQQLLKEKQKLSNDQHMPKHDKNTSKFVAPNISNFPTESSVQVPCYTDWPNELLENNSQDIKPANLNNVIIPEVPRHNKPSLDSLAGSKENNLSGGLPSIDRSLKPPSLLSPGVHSSSNKYGLRDVIVPTGLMASFTRLAQNNTDKNIETCGILAGRLAAGKFNITHLLIPKQSGTSDSCTTENEEELFDYQDNYDLITLGWIHTHPSQTSFMSSVDLHTHCSYQLMMHEAIAIVVAPKYNETGVFSLTPNHGLDFIASCRLEGFHPHPKEPPLYEDSSHVQLVDGLSATVVDLRK